MSNKYHYDRLTHKHRRRRVFIFTVICVILGAGIIVAVPILINKNTKKTPAITGPTETVGQVTSAPSEATKVINEPTYKFSLPATWQQIVVHTNPETNFITWESFAKGLTARYITIYTNPIPATFAVNVELPVQANGSAVTFGSLSGNCADFTGTGSPKSLAPILAKWQNVNFYCNMPSYTDNVVGTGTIGAINSVTLTGPKSGPQNYFFVYIDRTPSPDYSILYSILDSFRSK